MATGVIITPEPNHLACFERAAYLLWAPLKGGDPHPEPSQDALFGHFSICPPLDNSWNMDVVKKWHSVILAEIWGPSRGQCLGEKRVPVTKPLLANYDSVHKYIINEASVLLPVEGHIYSRWFLLTYIHDSCNLPFFILYYLAINMISRKRLSQSE